MHPPVTSLDRDKRMPGRHCSADDGVVGSNRSENDSCTTSDDSVDALSDEVENVLEEELMVSATAVSVW